MRVCGSAAPPLQCDSPRRLVLEFFGGCRGNQRDDLLFHRSSEAVCARLEAAVGPPWIPILPACRRSAFREDDVGFGPKYAEEDAGKAGWADQREGQEGQ